MSENKILKKFEATDVVIEVIDGVPMFEVYSTGMALGYTKSNVLKGKKYVQCRKDRVDKTLKNAEIKGLVHDGLIFITENQLYDFMLEAHTSKCKSFRKWIVDDVLPTINKTGGYVSDNSEKEFIENYFPDFSEETKLQMLKELTDSNKKYREENEELKSFYDALLNTEGLMPMNLVAKELRIGVKRLYSFLRDNDVMFYKGKVNVPYQRFMEQKLFEIKETPCRDGNYRPQTYATKKGLDYIRKMMASKQEVVA